MPVRRPERQDTVSTTPTAHIDLLTCSLNGESRGILFRVGDLFPMDPRPHRDGKYPPLSRFPGCTKIRNEFRASERVATLVLARLREQKYIQTEGRGSTRHYFVLSREMWPSRTDGDRS